jgi:hypothetical protein
MSADPDKLGIAAEADRLSGVYLRIRLLAQAQGVDVIAAGRDAVAKGIVAAADWELVREAITER